MSEAITDIEVAREVAARLHVSTSTLNEWARRGRFPNIRYPHTKVVRFPRAWTDAFLSGRCELEMQPLAGGGRIVRPKGVR